MTVVSKEVFYNKVDENTKCDIIHFWHEHCLEALLSPEWLSRVVTGSAKYFFPIYVVKLLINYKKIKNKKFLLSLLFSEIRSTGYGTLMASLFIFSLCIMRAIFGRVYYHTVLMTPGIISGLAVLMESKENQILDTLVFFNALVETMLTRLGMSTLMQTVMFMCICSFVMANFENRETKLGGIYFWFYSPQKEEYQNIDKKCDHVVTCTDYILRGFQKYFTVGFALNIIRTFLSTSKLILKKPTMLFEVLFNIGNCRLGLFIGSFVGLYRAITCYFTRSRNIKPNKSSFVAGLLAGATYAIYPKIQILVMAVTTTLQMLYDYISKRLNITNHFWQRQLLFMLCNGYLLHSNFMFSNTCSPYYKSMVDGCTGGMTKTMYTNMISRVT